jgi:hypothetical protein
MEDLEALRRAVNGTEDPLRILKEELDDKSL